MPRPKRNNTNQMNASSKVNNKNCLTLAMLKAEIKDKMKDSYAKLSNMQKEKIAMFELEFRNYLMAFPKNILNKVVDINSEVIRAAILGIDAGNKKNNRQHGFFSPVELSLSRRRTRSSVVKLNQSARKNQRIRSTSVDVYKTPKGRVRLSSIMSDTKYTVTKSKKAENSGVHLKRIMKPNEEAISTYGSPLYVASCNLRTPHVNIPLPGGVVLNIEPKATKGQLKVPELDEKTKNQIKMLYEQLNELL